jgi:hypothetical protein
MMAITTSISMSVKPLLFLNVFVLVAITTETSYGGTGRLGEKQLLRVQRCSRGDFLLSENVGLIKNSGVMDQGPNLHKTRTLDRSLSDELLVGF